MSRKFKRSQNGPITNPCRQDKEKSTTNTTGNHGDVIPTADSQDMPSDAEFAALRELLPNDTGEGTMRGFPGGGETDSTLPEHATSAYLSEQEVILAEALKYIQDLEDRKQRLYREKISLGLMRIVYTWRRINGMVRQVSTSRYFGVYQNHTERECRRARADLKAR
ncbi:hypothetical protein BKA64DRAFT_257507 [Cadophora sp. MPI-SDFR-AT-0126]|nr:hypothetical protein BKA64DRAFT_257507 [Leotiomycetes sp. MPI-SDFR-AT-0126]